MSKLIYKEELITPTRAKQLLEANIKNRLVKRARVDMYANDIINGRWKEHTGESIKISETGLILDGQHRLHAIIQANKAIVMLVISGIEDSVFDVIDTGSSRNASDAFKISDIKHGCTIPSIMAMYNLLQEGKRAKVHVNQKSTNAMLIEQYYLDEDFWQNIAKQSHQMYQAFAKILQPSFIGGFYAHFYKINPEKADDFMKQLTTGMDINNKTISLLRNRLMHDKMSVRKINPTIKMALIIKTWNCFVKGESLKVLTFDPILHKFPQVQTK
jgi:hypothetical protein